MLWYTSPNAMSRALSISSLISLSSKFESVSELDSDVLLLDVDLQFVVLVKERDLRDMEVEQILRAPFITGDKL